jgi:hypothetical protein
MYYHPTITHPSDNLSKKLQESVLSSKLPVINLFAGPGSGKSTVMAETFAKLKRSGINCEMAPEWVKMAAWEGRSEVFSAQGYILEKQNWVLQRLRGKVEVVVSDSPLLLAAAYCQLAPNRVYDGVNWKSHCKSIFDTYDNFNIFLKRSKPYNPSGRTQDYETAKKVDSLIMDVLNEFNIPHFVLEDSPTVHEEIIKLYTDNKRALKTYY